MQIKACEIMIGWKKNRKPVRGIDTDVDILVLRVA